MAFSSTTPSRVCLCVYVASSYWGTFLTCGRSVRRAHHHPFPVNMPFRAGDGDSLVLLGVLRWVGTGEHWAGLERAGWSLQNRNHYSRAHTERWPDTAGGPGYLKHISAKAKFQNCQRFGFFCCCYSEIRLK